MTLWLALNPASPDVDLFVVAGSALAKIRTVRVLHAGNGSTRLAPLTIVIVMGDVLLTLSSAVLDSVVSPLDSAIHQHVTTGPAAIGRTSRQQHTQSESQGEGGE